MKTYPILILMLLCAFGALAQGNNSDLSKAEDSLKVLADTFMTSRDIDRRLAAAEAFADGLYEALESDPQSFGYYFDSLVTVSKLYPADSTFRIFTWQLYVDVDEYKYFGIIQQRGSVKRGLPQKTTRLEDYSGRMRKIEDKVYSADNWYGALYYNIEPFETEEGMKYALFGFDAYKFFERRKLMEILFFDEQRNPVFGAPLIQYTVPRKDLPAVEYIVNRFMIQYSAEASASINYNEQERMVLFDNLIRIKSPSPDIPYTMVPDGSYHAFRLKDGMWMHVDKVYSHTYDEAPRPDAILGNGKKKKKKDIFGRE